MGLTTLPCKKIVEKPPRKSAIFNGRRLQRRPRPKLGCGGKEEEGDHAAEDEMGGASSTHGRDNKCIQFWLRNLKGRTTWKTQE
jgi:hypothetical protein